MADSGFTMIKKTPVTEYANLAMEELHQLQFVSQQIVGDIKYDESVLEARNKSWPNIAAVTNKPFNDVAFRFIGVSQLCRAVDIYNWYCCEALKLALSCSPQLVVDVLRRQKGRIAEAVSKAEKKVKDAAAEIIQQFLQDKYKGDWNIREALHRNLDVMQNPEIELLCLCRNVLVHKQGHDEFGEVADAIKNLGSERALIGAQWYPPGHMPLALDEKKFLVVNEAVGDWAGQLMQQQIFMMDQNFAHIYKLPRQFWEQCKISRTFLGTPRHQ
jgi:hypothetical protein